MQISITNRPISPFILVFIEVFPFLTPSPPAEETRLAILRVRLATLRQGFIDGVAVRHILGSSHLRRDEAGNEP